ncbi:pilus assembly protein [Leucobacter allii]|uniref:Pilus assembly protein n=1 Tax=Leucobacter allii TaxID=2932247 RepID=A0ABY4FIL1_9MICO|nr:TadE family type IV pilus minor pilin [Leucobacter allii]UOQ56528.1 pilus assembly protein [Leucobacter allii]
MTAEFAVVMPAVLVVLGLAIGGVLLAAHRLVLVSLVGEVARLEARGDLDLAAARLAETAAGAEVERERDGPLHCVSVSERPGDGLLAAIGVSALACAAVSGEGAVP